MICVVFCFMGAPLLFQATCSTDLWNNQSKYLKLWKDEPLISQNVFVVEEPSWFSWCNFSSFDPVLSDAAEWASFVLLLFGVLILSAADKPSVADLDLRFVSPQLQHSLSGHFIHSRVPCLGQSAWFGRCEDVQPLFNTPVCFRGNSTDASGSIWPVAHLTMQKFQKRNSPKKNLFIYRLAY